MNYRSNAEAAEAIAAEVGGIAVAGDVADPEQVKALVEQVESELGDIDALVNNAGVTRDTLIARMSDEDWNAVLDTNLRGTFHMCRAVARKMLRRRAGSIVNLTSVVGLHGNAGQVNYAASKARDRRPHEVAGERAREPRRARECDRARLHRHGADRGAARRRARI